MFAIKGRLKVALLVGLVSLIGLGVYGAFQTHDADAMGGSHRYDWTTSREYDTIVGIRTVWGTCPYCGGSVRETYTTRQYKNYAVKVLQMYSHGQWVTVAEVEKVFLFYDTSEWGPSWVCLNANCGG